MGIAAILGSLIVGLCCFVEGYPRDMTWRLVAAVAIVTVLGGYSTLTLAHSAGRLGLTISARVPWVHGLLQLISLSFGVDLEAAAAGATLFLIAIIGSWSISLFVFPVPMLEGNRRFSY